MCGIPLIRLRCLLREEVLTDNIKPSCAKAAGFYGVNQVLFHLVHVEKFVGVMFAHLLQHLHHDRVLLAPLEHGTVGDVIKSIAAALLRLTDSAELRGDLLVLNRRNTKREPCGSLSFCKFVN